MCIAHDDGIGARDWGDNMAEQQITPGTKLQVAFDVPMGQKTDFNMLATYKENLDDAYFLMSAPMLAGKPLIMDENQKLLLQYKVGEETFVLAGYPESVEKKGIHTYWKMRKVAEQRTLSSAATSVLRSPCA